jgi:hypothetical protein
MSRFTCPFPRQGLRASHPNLQRILADRPPGGQSRRIKLQRKSMQTKIFFNTVGNIPLCREDGGIL